MTALFDKHDLPTHLFDIAELDLHEDLFMDRLGGLWFRLGEWTIKPQRNEQSVEDVIFRQSVMLSPSGFAEIYNKLDYVGNVLHGLGHPEGSLSYEKDQKKYSYNPFYRFEIGFGPSKSVVCEPLVFVQKSNPIAKLFINQDLELFFELEEKTSGSGIWWDPRRGAEAFRRRVIENGNLQIVEIRTDYLRSYLQARQVSLLVGHYRHLRLYNPSDKEMGLFVEEEVVRCSPDQEAKAIIQNRKLPESLLRELHLWFEIKPIEIDIDDPWADEPPFDPYEFTLPTQYGPVAPGRWEHFRETEGREFKGEICDFLTQIYFRQEVLSKYQGAAGFEIRDDGSVSHKHYWGLVRSTSRIGNELLTTYIGDFAEGVPFEEWQHWKQYAVEPPSSETINSLREERPIPDAVNSLFEELTGLNNTFARLADVREAYISDLPWRGSLDSLTGRQLKWVYPTTADDDEFLKRATLLSTLVVDGLAPQSLRKLLQTWDSELHLNPDGQPLGSLNLLLRVTLIAALAENLQPTTAVIPVLLKQMENQASNADNPDLQIELNGLNQKIRAELAPLNFLYEIRTHGGITHFPSKKRVEAAAVKLHLPESNWHRTDYLHLLDLVSGSVRRVSDHLQTVAEIISNPR